MEIKKKNGFFTFIFSFVPGAVEMYMGLMKNGFSILLIFAASIALASCLPGLLESFFIAFAIVTWIYAFFHGWNIYSQSPECLAQMEDGYIWNDFADERKCSIPDGFLKKAAPVALIVIGVSAIWNYVSGILIRQIPDEYWDDLYLPIRELPQLVIAILFVVIGIQLIKGKKKKFEEEAAENTTLIAEQTKED